MRPSTQSTLIFAGLSLVFLRGEGCGESAQPPPRADGGIPTGSVLDCQLGAFDLVMIPGEDVDLPDCGLGAGFDARVEGSLPTWALLDRDTETGRRRLRVGLEAPVGGPVAITLILSAPGGSEKRLKINLTIAVMSGALELGATTPGVRVEREWSASAPGKYVVVAGEPFDLIARVRSVHNLDVVSWMVSSVADPFSGTPYDGNLRRYFTLEEGAWDVTVEVRDQQRNTVTLGARVFAMTRDAFAMVVVSQPDDCPEAKAALMAAVGPCDAVDTSGKAICARVDVVDRASPLSLKSVGIFIRDANHRAQTLAPPVQAKTREQVVATCMGALEVRQVEAGADFEEDEPPPIYYDLQYR